MKETTPALPPSVPAKAQIAFASLRDGLPLAFALVLLIFALVVPLDAAESSEPAGAPRDEVTRQRSAAFEFARGKLLAEEGSFEKALKAYHRALELDSSDAYSQIEVAKFHSHLSQISRSAGKRLEYLQSAADFAAEARRLDPDNLEILQSYAQVHLRLGEHQLGALDQAQEAYEELRGRVEGDLQVLTSLGQIYLWKQKGESAVEVLEEAASYRPGHRMIQTMLLDALLKVERHLDAEKVLAQLIEIEPASLEYRLRLAELQGERGDHRAAAQVLASAPAEMLENTRLKQFLAQELHLSGANDEALALTEALLEKVPYSPGMRRLRVAILSSLARYGDAIVELEPLLASKENDDRIVQDKMLLSRLLERVGRLEEAAELLRQQTDEASAEGRLQLKLGLIGVLERQGLADEAIDILGQEIAAADEHLPMLSRALSELLARVDRAGDGLVVLEDAITRLKASNRSEAAERLALRRLLVMAAVDDWARLIEQAPALFDASSREIRSTAEVLYADALANQGRLDDALQVLSTEASDIGVQRRVARKAELLHEHGRATEADKLLNDVIATGDDEDLFFATQIYQRLELFADSIPLLERLADTPEIAPRALFLLGAAHERLGDHAKAVTAFRRLLEVVPNHAPTLNYLGYMWAELGENLTEALSMILRAVALDPDNGAYVDSLGWAYFQDGRYQEARGHLEWAARLVPEDPTILEHLGDVYVALKDFERARVSYQQALDLGGDDDDLDEEAETLRRKLETLDEKDL